jgi:hypothetical protein
MRLIKHSALVKFRCHAARTLYALQLCIKRAAVRQYYRFLVQESLRIGRFMFDLLQCSTRSTTVCGVLVAAGFCLQRLKWSFCIPFPWNRSLTAARCCDALLEIGACIEPSTSSCIFLSYCAESKYSSAEAGKALQSLGDIDAPDTLVPS